MQEKAGTQSGVAIIEFMLVLPLLFFFSVAVVDMTRWIVTYIDTSRVAYEGARYAASVKDLSVAAAIVDPYGDDVIPSDAHGSVVTRMQRVMTEQAMDPTSVYLRVERTDADTSNSVEVEVRVPFEPYASRFTPGTLMDSLKGFTSCETIVRAPYLFPSDT
jgi:Flp pilus assembly protein TadG